MNPPGTLTGTLTALWLRALRGPGIVAGGRILSPYGYRTVGGRRQFHLGIDLQGTTGTAVRAVAPGAVVGVWHAGELTDYGNTVVVAHVPREDAPRTAALYAHLSRITPGLGPGDVVRKGQAIGAVGSSGFDEGSTTPPHLHLEILVSPDGTGRAFTHFHGGPNWFPPRVDPDAFANAMGMDLT